MKHKVEKKKKHKKEHHVMEKHDKKEHEHHEKHKKHKKEGKVAKVLHEFHEKKLHSGSKNGPLVTNPKQALAISLSEARKAGEKVSPKKKRK